MKRRWDIKSLEKMGALKEINTAEDTWYDPEGYDAYIQGEFNSFRKDAWKDVFRFHLKENTALEILDLGTGPGFFACILSEMGHHVTGIDGSKGMLAAAAKNAEILGVHPTLMYMNYNDLKFEADTFDVIVCRNVTWTMADPVAVYKNLLNILKPGGRFIIYDANWHHHYMDPKMDAKVLALEEEHERIYGLHRDIAGHIDEDTKEFLESHPIVTKDRPYWDQQILESLGAEVTLRFGLEEKVYTDWEKHLYQMHPLFEILAKKNK